VNHGSEAAPVLASDGRSVAHIPKYSLWHLAC
jgi:hypothetical protein